jgi:hypothetical protein
MTELFPPGWIVTFTGRRVWPLDLRVADIAVDDIAHALAMKVRWGGFCRSFYSVAQHTVLLADWLGLAGANWQDQWDALHHDDVEVYFADIPAPVREMLDGYDEAEAHAWSVIAGVFGCSATFSDTLRTADRRIRADEARVLMTMPPGGWGDHGGGLEPLGVVIKPWGPDEAKARWLAALDRLQATRPTPAPRRAALEHF